MPTFFIKSLTATLARYPFTAEDAANHTSASVIHAHSRFLRLFIIQLAGKKAHFFISVIPAIDQPAQTGGLW